MNNELRTIIRHGNRSATEYGYGLYINGYVVHDEEESGAIWASECVSPSASPETIKRVERNVRRRALYHYRKVFEL